MLRKISFYEAINQTPALCKISEVPKNSFLNSTTLHAQVNLAITYLVGSIAKQIRYPPEVAKLLSFSKAVDKC
ncbi:MAG: hypothetical protein CVT94_00860 [Bacteroidetes bacterium HGW-Bacteroidetes-11]|nr:MAG: hypothetical protein CVT94_00860 [Bacteroidetes bacterium HGW-Bacteroidetes-11]